jgi:hypothetical protein
MIILDTLINLIIRMNIGDPKATIRIECLSTVAFIDKGVKCDTGKFDTETEVDQGTTG